MSTLPNITSETIKAYQDEVAKNASPATAKRKAISLNRFFDWAATEGHIPANPMGGSVPVSGNNPFIVSSKKKSKISVRTLAIIGMTGSMAVLIFLLMQKLQLPIPFILTPAQESKIQVVSNTNQTTLPPGQRPSGPEAIPANSAGNVSWNLYAKLKLSDSSGTPRVGSETLNFKLFDSPTNGTQVYSSDPQNITTDANGSALISLPNVPSNLFFQNNTLFLEPQIASASGQGGPLSARIPVSTANTPSNIGGFFPANPDTGAGPLTVPVIDSTGALTLASESPAIKAKQGNLLIEGQTVTIKSTDGGGGNIEFNPDGNGYAHFLFEGNKGNFLNAQGPNLTSGSLYYGMVPNNATGYDLIRLQNGAPIMTTKFSVDAFGNTKIAGDLYTGGTDRLTKTGALENITGYSQTSGNFTITQNPGDFASITKNSTALTDVLNLSLDENMITGSHYSTLVLNRLGGDPNARALLVNTGDAQFNGQVQLGNFTSNPTAIGGGSLVFNTTDNTLYFWNGSAWVSVGTATTTPFSGILSGTNTTATMVVGSGASLSFTGTGTITASNISCAGCVTNSALANSAITINTGGILTGGGAVSLGGTLNLTATEADTLNSVTTRGATTANAITVGNLTDSGLTASKGVFTDAAKQLTSTGTLGADQGGTGHSVYVVGDTLYADTTTSLARLADVAVGNVLLSGGVGAPPTYGKVILGTHTTGNYVSTITGTANQITASAATGDVTLSIPSDFRAPGTVNAVNGIYTGPVAGTQRIDALGNLVNIANISASGYATISGSLALGSASAAPGPGNLNMSGNLVASGTITGTTIFQGANQVCDISGNCSAVGNFWGQTLGALYPVNNTVDVLFGATAGATATQSAKFAFTGVNSGTPTASIAGTTNAGALFMDGNGNISETNRNNLTLGNSATYNSTGNILLNPNGTGRVGVNTAAPINNFEVSGTAAAPLTSGSSQNGITRISGLAGVTKVIDSGLTTGASGVGWLQVRDGTNYGVDYNLSLQPNGGNVGIGTVTPTALLDVNGNASVSGTLAFHAGTGTIQTTTFSPLVIGGSTTGNITLNPSNAIAGGFVAPNTTNVTDLGTASLLWRNIYGTTIYQGANQVCDLSGNCGAVGNYWGQSLGALYPVNNTVDVLFGATAGATATQSAKFAFTGINTGGTPTASIAGTVANVATFIDGNGNISSTNRNNLTLGNSATYNSTGNILLNPNGTGRVGIGKTLPLFTLDIAGNASISSTLSLGPMLQVDAGTCNASSAGKEYYDATQNTYFFCNGTIWTQIGSGSGGSFWDQTLGALYPLNNTVDVLFGATAGTTATTSAKFAFTGINGGLPTASISGNIASVATYLTGDGNLATTNMRDLTLGGSSTGQVILNSRGTAALTANGSAVTVAGNLNSSAATATLFNTTTTNLTFGGAATTFNIAPTGASGSIAFSGGSGDTGCTLDGVTGNFTCSGNIIGSGTTQGFWTQNLGALFPTNNTVDVLFGASSGATATTSAKFAFTGINTGGTPTASIAGTVTNAALFMDGNGNISTTNRINLTLGNSTTYNTTGNILLNPNGTGSVGIGTTIPTALLDVAGTASISGSLTFRAGAGSIQTTTFSPLTIGGATTGNITLNPSNGIAGGNVSPGINNVTDLGTSLLMWRNIYANSATLSGTLSLGPMLQIDAGTCNASSAGKEYYDATQNTYYFCNGTIWTQMGSGSGTNFWQLTANSLSPVNSTYAVNVGDTASTSAFFHVPGTNNQNAWFNLGTGNVGIGTTGPDKALEINSATGANLRLTYNDNNGSAANFADFAMGSTGDITLTPSGGQLIMPASTSINVGGLSNVVYNAFALSTDTPAMALATIGHSNDLFVGGNLELKGGLYLTGKNIFNPVGSGGTATAFATISLAVDPTALNNDNELTNGGWLIQNDANPGLAALRVNQTYAGPDIFDASAAGTLRFSIANNGVTKITTTVASTSASLVVSDSSGTGLGKIDVGTVDPPYTINGTKYATYLPSMTGVKEETAGIASTDEYVAGVGYRNVIDFNNLPQGGDLWLFGKTTNIKANMDKLVALLTPSSPTRVWYDVDQANSRLIIYSARPTQISYRLTGPRFNSEVFPNQRLADDPTAGFILNSLDVINNSPVVSDVQQLAGYILQKVQDGVYTLKDPTGVIVDGVESIGNFVAANIKAGFIQTQDLATERFQTKIISPVPGNDLAIQLNQNSRFVVQDSSSKEVASIDDQGNATFAGDVHAQNIDKIQSLLNQVTTDQSILLAATSGANLTASGSANLSNLIASDLYITGHAAISSLLVNDNLSVGNINSLSEPLQLQSLAMAPIEIMAGLVTIDTKGNVQIAGNLNVGGKITTPEIDTGTINATGSATFSSLSTTGLVIGAPDATVSGVVANGEITTNSTVGKAVIPAGVSEITIKNPKVTDYTLVYVTPTSPTQNNVLYIKSKQAGQFVVGFTDPITVDTSFNWWIVQVQ